MRIILCNIFSYLIIIVNKRKDSEQNVTILLQHLSTVNLLVSLIRFTLTIVQLSIINN